MGYGAGDDYRAAVCGVSELHHAGKRLPVIASLATFATVWVWIMILLSQIAFRRRLPPEEVKALKFKVPVGRNHHRRFDFPALYYRVDWLSP